MDRKRTGHCVASIPSEIPHSIKGATKMASGKPHNDTRQPFPAAKEIEIQPLSDEALEEVAGGGDPTGSPLCGPPDTV
jgi:hypothetical protein